MTQARTADPLAQALRYHHQGQFARAERAYRDLLRTHPRHPEALRLLGVLMCQAGQIEHGIELLRKAVKLAKSNPTPLIDLGRALAENGEPAEAIDCYRKAVRLAPAHAPAWGGLGMVLFKLGRTAEAVEALRKALASGPAHPDLHVVLGNALRRLGQLAEAASEFRKAIALKPDYAEVFTNLGNIAIELGDFDEAIANHRRAVDLKPGVSQLHQNLGGTFHTARRYGDAAAALRDAVRLDPRNVDALIALASSLKELGRLEECLPVLERAQRLRPGDAAATQIHLLVLNELGRPVAEFERVADALPDLAARTEAYAALANALETMNNLEQARAATAKVLALDADHVLANVVAARLARRAGDVRGARDRLLGLAARGVGLNAAAHTVLGQAHDRLKEYDAAFAAFAAAKQCARAELGDDLGAWQEQYLDHVREYGTWYTPAKAATWAAEAAPADANDPIFFVGFPRSGTTLFEQILGSHPRLVTTGESQILSRLLLIAPSLLGRSEQPPALLDRLTADEVATLARWYRNEAARTCGVAPGSKRVVDKMPLNIVEIGFIRRILPGAPVIVALRDPRDVILSCFMQNFRINRAMAHFLSIEGTARLYAEVMGLWLHYRADPGLRAIAYRYEDLIADVAGVARRVFAFLGEAWDDGVLDYRRHRAERFVSTPSYADVAAPIYDRSIGRWRNYRRHLEPALPILAPFVREFGYPET